MCWICDSTAPVCASCEVDGWEWDSAFRLASSNAMSDEEWAKFLQELALEAAEKDAAQEATEARGERADNRASTLIAGMDGPNPQTRPELVIPDDMSMNSPDGAPAAGRSGN